MKKDRFARPLECRCNVIDALHRRFVETFRLKTTKRSKDEMENRAEERNLSEELIMKAFRKVCNSSIDLLLGYLLYFLVWSIFGIQFLF